MSDEDVRQDMAELARRLSAEAGLEPTAAGLERLEEDFGRLHEAHGARALGAFLGEVIVALGSGAIRWVCFETAAAGSRQVAALGKDDETAAVLQAGTSFWFPHVKVAKRRKNGPSDSLVAFKGVVLAMAAPPRPAARPEPAGRDDFPAPVREAVERFLAAPSPATLRDFVKEAMGKVLGEHYGALFRLFGVRADPFLALFSVPDEGRGIGRFSASGIAAEWVVLLFQAGVEPVQRLEEIRVRLADGDARTRESAARVLMACWTWLRDWAPVQELAATRDKAVQKRAFFGLGAELRRQKRLSNRTEPPDMELVAPVLLLGLAAERQVVEETLGIVSGLVGWADVSRVLPPALAALHRKEPALVESVLHLVENYARGVQHGKAQYVPVLSQTIGTIVELVQAKPGAKKTTKIQIAARYALGALSSLEGHLEPEALALARRGLEAAKHIR
jgi:hypothetical protein